MNINSVYENLPSAHKQIIAGSLATESVHILFYDAMQQEITKLQEMDIKKSAEDFKSAYTIAKKSIMVYEDILYLINQIRKGNANEIHESN